MGAAVSIVVGVYNGERYLAELLDSVLSQTFADWICLCVDDGSTDASAGILRAYARKDGRFRIIARPNGGVGAARNTALDALETPYVMFADQDDRLLPDALAVACRAIRSSGADIVRFASNRRVRHSIFVWEHIMRTEAVKNVRFPPITGGEDTAFFWELDFLKLKRAEIADELYYNRPNGGSFSRDVSPGYVRNVFSGFAAMWSTGRRYRMSRPRLFAKLFPGVFWFSASVLLKHPSPGNVRALARGLAGLFAR
jgi:glycosyltransferase involved in cell wall biosynthesis